MALVRWSGLPWLVRNTWARRKVTIFRYHDPDPESFRRQLRYLSRCYTLITLDRLVDALEARDWSGIPRKSLVVTFDDGWRGNARLLEICREFGVVPTVYLCSGLVGTGRHFWWTEAAGQDDALKGLSSAAMEQRLRRASGFEFTREYDERQALSVGEIVRARLLASFQSHSRFHRILTGATLEEREEEVVRSRDEVSELAGAPCVHFSYPNGSYDPALVDLVRGAGYRSARTTDVGWNDLDTDPFALRIAGGSDRGGANAAAASLFGMYVRLVLRGSFRGRFRDVRTARPPAPTPLPRPGLPRPARPRLRTPADSRPRVLVTDAETRTALAACRSLAAAGFAVTAAASTSPAAAQWSRSCAMRRRVPDPRLDRSAYVRALAEIVAETHHDAVLPASDASLLAISFERHLLEPHVDLGLPPHEVVERATDKRAIAAAAVRAGLRPPETVRCRSLAHAPAAATLLGFPLVVKATRSVTPTADGMLRERVSRYAGDLRALRQALDGHEGEVLLQRAVPGAVWSVAGVVEDGRLLATAVSRYARTWPRQGGFACFSEVVRAPGDLVERVRVLLCELGWEGIFEVELVRRDDGSFGVIDVNPRLYGSLALAVAAGAPLPAVWCWRLARLAGPPAPPVAHPGHRYRHEDGDLRYAASSLAGGRFAAAAATLRPRRRVVHAYASLRDPVPLVARALEIGVGRFRRPPSLPIEAPAVHSEVVPEAPAAHVGVGV